MDTDARPADLQGPPRPIPEMDAAAAPTTRPHRCLETCGYVVLVVLIGLMAIAVVGTLVLLVCAMVEEIRYKEPNYSVAIAAVSGLDQATDLGRRPALDPEFNLTVLIAQRSSIVHPCGFPGTTVRVSYHGFELASAAAPKFCETQGTRTIVARGGRVWLPGPALDNLAADLRRAAGAFDVTITIPNTGSMHGVVRGLMISCMGRRLGEDIGGAALCDVREVEHATSEQ